MQKGFILPLIIIFGLILTGLVIYKIFIVKPQPENFVTPSTSSESEDLKTYTNNLLGIEFKYEKNLEVNEDSEEEFNKRGNGDFRKNFTYYVTYSPAKVLGVVAVLDKSGSHETNPLTVWVFENPENLSIDKWYGNFWYYPFVWGDYTLRRNDVAPINEATVSGQIAKFGIVTYQPGEPKFVYLSTEKKMYLFRIIGESGDKILFTFKFLP